MLDTVVFTSATTYSARYLPAYLLESGTQIAYLGVRLFVTAVSTRSNGQVMLVKATDGNGVMYEIEIPRTQDVTVFYIVPAN